MGSDLQRLGTRLVRRTREHPSLAQAAPLFGVTGTLYGYGDEGVYTVDGPKKPLPYGHEHLRLFLASRQVRRLQTFRLISMQELTRALRAVGT